MISPLSHLYHLICLACCCIHYSGVFAVAVNPFVDDTKILLANSTNQRLLAFLDLDGDKKTDILTFSALDNSVQIIHETKSKERSSSSLAFSGLDTSNISSFMPGDFDGDLVTDFVVVNDVLDGVYNLTKHIQVCFGSRSSLEYECKASAEIGKDDPILLDFDGDMKPDLLVNNLSGKLVVVSSESRNLSSQVISDWEGELVKTSSNAFVDVNHDLAADVVLVSRKGLIIILNQNGQFNISQNCSIDWPASWSRDEQVGKLAFMDYDSDSYMDIIVPILAYQQTALYLLSGSKLANLKLSSCNNFHASDWINLNVQLRDEASSVWQISSVDGWLRVGDINNDGHFDLLATLRNVQTNVTRPFILLNTKANETSNHLRTFEVMWNWLSVDYNITQSAFYDLNHDGLLDVIVNADHQGSTEIHVLRNVLAKEACFVSVKVGSGLCPHEDDLCTKPYVNTVGATITYNSTYPDGTSAHVIAAQLPQSAGGALLLPYIQFGLGTTPNFLDSFTIGIPRHAGSSKWSQTWKTIIPNSHLFVVPRPPDKPDMWLLHLSVTPSHLVVITGGVIVGLCGFISIVIGLLHLKEKHQDRKAKLQESHRFHFSAM